MTLRAVYQIIFAFCLVGTPILTAQNHPAQPVSPIPPRDIEEKMARERLKKANLQRQAQIKSDTDKLLQLSTELKAYVDKTNENVLSVEVIKKAEEIEKLAHHVKEKMKNDPYF